jgi:Cysteine rich repeat
MTRLLMIPLLLMAGVASAQNGQPRQDPGCARDVARHCRSKMNDGDQVILACLKEHRTSLSKTCAKVLTDNGQ